MKIKSYKANLKNYEVSFKQKNLQLQLKFLKQIVILQAEGKTKFPIPHNLNETH